MGAVGATLHQLEVVVAERPEEGLRALEGAGVVVVVEGGGGVVHQVGELPEHRFIEASCDLAFGSKAGEDELGGVEDLDGEAAADLELVAVELEVAAGAGAARPVADGVGAVSLEDVEGVVGCVAG